MNVCVHILYIVPSGPPEKVNVYVVNSTLVRATWHPPLDDQQNGEILNYTVTFSLSTGSHPTHYLTTNLTRILLPHLRPFSEYSLTVAANTRIGGGPFLEPNVIFSTPEAGKHTGPPLTVVVMYVFDVFFLHCSYLVL